MGRGLGPPESGRFRSSVISIPCSVIPCSSRRKRPPGGSATLIAGSQTNPTGVIADASGVYWTNRVGSIGTVMAAPLAGGTARTLASNQDEPYGITSDSVAVYWTNRAGGQVMKIAK